MIYLVSWSVCCNLNEDCINSLNVALNNAVRYILSVKHGEHITPYYVKLGWLKIRERLDTQILVMTHKILFSYSPSYLNDLFVTMENVHTRSTRSHKLYLQAPPIGKGVPERCFSVSGYRLWNGLNPNLYSIRQTAIFKNKVEQILLSKYLQSKY